LLEVVIADHSGRHTNYYCRLSFWNKSN